MAVERKTFGAEGEMNIIVAYDKNRAIGKDGKIPWHLSDDLKRFKKITMGRPIIMGRKTWDSLPVKPLPGRLNIIFTRERRSLDQPDVWWVDSFESAMAAGMDSFIIGGESIYKQALEKGIVNRVIASEVKGEYEGDTFFPELEGEWDRRIVEQYDEFDVVEYRKVVIPGKCSFERCVTWIKPPGIVVCKECGKEWCCMECACEDDALDHDTFEMIYDMEEVPETIPVTCCHCSGKKPSWMELNDDDQEENPSSKID